MHEEDIKELFQKKASREMRDSRSLLRFGALATCNSRLRNAIDRLGNGNASTHFGAIEGLGLQVQKIGQALNGLASSFDGIAEAITSAAPNTIE